HLAVGVDAIDGLDVDLPRFITDITWVGEVDAALAVDADVVGAVEAFAHPPVGQDADGAVLLGDGDAAIAALVGALAGHETPLRIEVETVGPAARVAVLRRPATGGIVLHDAIADVREVDAAARTVGRTLGELALAPQLFEFGVGRHDRVVLPVGGDPQDRQ